MGFSAEDHPSRILSNVREYAVAGSQLCRNCHTKFRTELHNRMAKIAAKGGRLCVDCHGAHSVEPVSKVASKDSEYCLGCHTNNMLMSFANGESRSVQIEADILRVSVHSKLYCSDCHFGFSPEEHPVRKFKSRRDFTISSSESCRRCHFDKYTKTLESIHYVILAQGNLSAPVCIDCHGSHSISQTGKERTLSATRCKTCHGSIYETYAMSVHGNALFQEHNQDVPVCADCHRAHNIVDPRTFDYREKIPQMSAVVKTYLKDFHGVTLKFYMKQKSAADRSSLKPIAVCIDCHGIHDITPTAGPDSSIVKANLLGRCQKCHPDASENFPDSWISHYEPTLKRAPLVFAINLMYKIFIPFMMVGLILQILLHIWRYTVNR
jgi:predicted CXXCH cytochrome family protein